MKTVNIGLIRGRHEMPVEDYIFDSIDDVFSFKEMEIQAWDKLKELYPYEHLVLNLYVTGLTAATLAVVNICLVTDHISKLNLLHYDHETESYKSQQIYI